MYSPHHDSSAWLDALLDRATALFDPRDPALQSITLAAPHLPLRHLPPLAPPYLFWEQPREGDYLLGIGRAAEAVAGGEGRLGELERRWREQASWRCHDPDGSGVEPVAFVACAFDPEDPMDGPWAGFANAGWFVPALLLRRRGGRTTVTFSAAGAAGAPCWRDAVDTVVAGLAASAEPAGRRSALVRVGSAPEPARWLRLVADATRMLRAGGLDKVVLARRVGVRGERRIDPARLCRILGELYPSCTLFAAAFGGHTLLGATPERLVRVQDGCVYSDALAGTERRAANETDDEALGRALLDSRKCRHEHRLVVDGIRAALDPLCATLQVPPEPRLARLRNLQHLHTPIEGRLAQPAGLLQVVERLHPTPAVGGTPRAAARRWLATHDNGTRGWYTGAYGWMDRRGEGEAAVLLRCALVREDRAELFAGAGIVADSEPSCELDETELKLATLLEALEDA